jgi:hypothetical protein
MAGRSHLTYSSAIVLQAASRGYRYGFDIMHASGLPGGTVYPALRRLEQSGFVKSSWESDEIARKAKRPRRRYYETTPVAAADAGSGNTGRRAGFGACEMNQGEGREEKGEVVVR